LARLRGLRSDLIDPAIAAHHGRTVKRTGDGSLVEFRSVVDAVRCAIEMQNGMVERNAGLPPERRIEFRIGIHVGDVVAESDGDLMGDGVNIAARLEGIAKPGSICLSEDAYRQVKSRLPSPVRFTTRPLCTAMVGSIRSLRSARKRARVRSSSALVRRLYPTTSAARMAASFRVSAMAVPSTQARLARLLVALDGLFRLADHCSPASN
jgi:class 3 adenylate cyclase